MLTINGELRKVLSDEYTDRKTGEIHSQAILVVEPSHGRQNYEVKLSRQHCKSGAQPLWEKLIGTQVSVVVNLYVNHEYKFHKFTAATGKPQE